MNTQQKNKRLPGGILSGSIALFLGMFLLSGCSRDKKTIEETVSFNAKIESFTRTTDGGDSWMKDDKVGIFMLTTGGSLATQTDLLAVNVAYNVADASTGALSPVGSAISYPESGNVDFLSYYPYDKEISASYTVSVSGQTTAEAQNTLDVLYAKTTNVKKSKTAVGFIFRHLLSKVTLNIKLGDGMTAFTGNDITMVNLSGMPQTTTINLDDGKQTAGPVADFPALKASKANNDYAATFSALLIPHKADNYPGRTAAFTIGGETNVWSIPNVDTFESGKHYTYEVKIEKFVITVGTPVITDWKTNYH